jgi:hypothetical protein
MGVDTRLVAAGSSVTPWQEMRWLTKEEMLAWNIENTYRRYTELIFRASGRKGAYVEVANVREGEASYLRLFCRSTLKEPLLAIITDFPYVAYSSPPRAEEVQHARDSVSSLLGSLTLTLDLGTERRTGLRFDVLDVRAAADDKGGARVTSLLRPRGFPREDAEKLTRVRLVDDDTLARVFWTFQDVAQFRINGDRRLIGIAMQNCVD